MQCLMCLVDSTQRGPFLGGWLDSVLAYSDELYGLWEFFDFQAIKPCMDQQEVYIILDASIYLILDSL